MIRKESDDKESSVVRMIKELECEMTKLTAILDRDKDPVQDKNCPAKPDPHS